MSYVQTSLKYFTYFCMNVLGKPQLKGSKAALYLQNSPKQTQDVVLSLS